jgi:hypothetical protein
LKVITDYTDRGLHKLVRIYAKAQLAETHPFKVSKPHAV